MVMLALVISLIALLTRAAWTDVTHRRIPNAVVGLICLLWLPWTVLAGFSTGITILIAFGVLFSSVLLWSAGLLGAGDAKLLSALALWAGPEHLLSTLFVIILAGGVIAMILLVLRWSCALLSGLPLRASDGTASLGVAPASTARLQTVPYGLAIATGGLWLGCRLIAG